MDCRSPYGKLLQAWKEAKPPPKTPEEVARLIVETLSRAQYQKVDVEGLLEFYGLPHPSNLAEISTGVPTRLPEFVRFQGGTRLPEFARFQGGTRLPEFVQFQSGTTLPEEVVGKTIPDGDGLNVYVDTDDPRESSNIPGDVLMAADQRSEARAMKNYAVADELHQKIIKSGYRVIDFQNEEILARKYRIRLRGIDALEMLMPFGEKAKQELVKLVDGKCLRVLVYGEDQYGRCVADVYCNHIFVQEVMLKKGLAWHYVTYDQRDEFVDGKRVPDGDGLNVYVNTDDPRESSNIPGAVLMAADRRSKARAKKNYAVADELHQKIIESGYGIDAPEMSMPFGKEAKEELVKLVHGKCLRVLVYGEDRYGRCVADIYCNGIFVQWQKEARTKKTGLWVQSNPEKPWEWRKKNKREGR
ncbi:hypothetical protein GOBAR_AA08687 [Gossypium barbadense]|uniref:TNase-like domain-containing protein n=1 Tax=Gossypium barbadense TaxID=3634 RepID=A0A2P5Y8L9_GOSBA|nr:hypothetical protein GOBAR_AA08687 [Gossypium barbadense]